MREHASCARKSATLFSLPVRFLDNGVMRYWKLELHKALELADELLAAAEDVKDPAMLMRGNHARGATLMSLGELVSANEAPGEGVGRFRHPPTPFRGVGVTVRKIRCYLLSVGLFALGYPDRAWAKSREMLEVAQRSSDPFILADAFCLRPYTT